QNRRSSARRRKPAPSNPLAKQFASIRDASANGADRVPQDRGRLLIRPVLHVAEDEWLAESLRQFAYLFVQYLSQLGGVFRHMVVRLGDRLHMNLPPALRGPADFKRYPT